ncbi:MAG: DUF1704 domain-containing protein [Nanoarchaeota archaeon]|nr:DUF1704 domain-containing protein [Nanoarchaeota archaeon]
MIDEILLNAGKTISILNNITPCNADEEKISFLKGNNPNFQYSDLNYEPISIATKLSNLRFPNNIIGWVYENIRKEIFLENLIVTHRGTELAKDASIKLYNKPSTILVQQAEKILSTTSRKKAPKIIPQDQIKEALEQEFTAQGLDWKVIYHKRKTTTAKPEHKEIAVCEDRNFTNIDLKRIPVHEFWVHTVRAVNGYEQPYPILAKCTAGYLPTEEGLTTYFEEITGTMLPETMISYAARLIAVDSMCRDFTFKETFDRLKSHNLNDSDSWELTLRAHRGGGYAKDQVYLQGYYLIKTFAKQDGDFKSLYVGKVGIQDLVWVRGMLRKGELNKPKLLPPFIPS